MNFFIRQFILLEVVIICLIYEFPMIIHAALVCSEEILDDLMKGEVENQEACDGHSEARKAHEGKVLHCSCIASKMQVTVEFVSTERKAKVALRLRPSVAQAEGEGGTIPTIAKIG
jgi:hypothetical protein